MAYSANCQSHRCRHCRCGPCPTIRITLFHQDDPHSRRTELFNAPTSEINLRLDRADTAWMMCFAIRGNKVQRRRKAEDMNAVWRLVRSLYQKRAPRT